VLACALSNETVLTAHIFSIGKSIQESQLGKNSQLQSIAVDPLTATIAYGSNDGRVSLVGLATSNNIFSQQLQQVLPTANIETNIQLQGLETGEFKRNNNAQHQRRGLQQSQQQVVLYSFVAEPERLELPLQEQN